MLQDLVLGDGVCSGTLPPALSCLRRLSRLEVVGDSDENRPTQLPPTLTALRSLTLDNCWLEEGAGAALACFSGLRELQLYDCVVPHSLPPQLGGLAQLSTLALNGSVVMGAEEEEAEEESAGAWASLPFAALTELRSLFLNRCGLRAVPDSLLVSAGIALRLSWWPDSDKETEAG